MASRLLVIDPHPGTRQVLREFLEGAGFQSEETSSLDGALAWPADSPPAAVVLHDGIGGAQGVEILKALRAQHPDLPVVFIADGPDRSRAVLAGLAKTACVHKPFRIEDLLEAVVRAVHGTAPLRQPWGVRRRPGRGTNNGRHRRAELPRARTG